MTRLRRIKSRLQSRDLDGETSDQHGVMGDASGKFASKLGERVAAGVALGGLQGSGQLRESSLASDFLPLGVGDQIVVEVVDVHRLSVELRDHHPRAIRPNPLTPPPPGEGTTTETRNVYYGLGYLRGRYGKAPCDLTDEQSGHAPVKLRDRVADLLRKLAVKVQLNERGRRYPGDNRSVVGARPRHPNTKAVIEGVLNVAKDRDESGVVGSDLPSRALRFDHQQRHAPSPCSRCGASSVGERGVEHGRMDEST